ncbi:collagen alpha-1(I) chain-like [Panthera tigris]|uniref:collagen alpha-1(I) chain-like n=1 Tax=Panthera tigris TaxID=9694 RepID=UPI001C6F73C7|nr:collagen alpha-1(I) chain-like [Panthera tigris]
MWGRVTEKAVARERTGGDTEDSPRSGPGLPERLPVSVLPDGGPARLRRLDTPGPSAYRCPFGDSKPSDRQPLSPRSRRERPWGRGRARRSSSGGGAARCPAGGRPVCAARAACGRDEDCPPRPERRGRRGRAGSSIVSASAANGAGPSEREVSVAARRLGSARGPGVCAAGHLAARDPPRPGRPRRRAAPAGPGDPPRGAPPPRPRSPGPGRAAPRTPGRAGGSAGAAALRGRPPPCPAPLAEPGPAPRGASQSAAQRPPLRARRGRRAGPPESRASGERGRGGGARAAAGRLIHCGPERLPPPPPPPPEPGCRLLRAAPGACRPRARPGASRPGRQRGQRAGPVLEASGSRRGAVPPPPGRPPLAGGLEGERRGRGDPSEPPASARALAARPGLGSDAPRGPGEAAFRAQLDPRDGGRRGAEAAGP